MLRTALLWCGALLLLGGAFTAVVTCCAAGPWPAGLWSAGLGAILLLAIVFERHRYKPTVDDVPGPDWQNTGERFVDPGSGNLVAVYFQPATGKRLYVRVGPGASTPQA